MIPQKLFGQPSFNTIRPLKISMSTAEKACGLSREIIVDQMNDLADQYGVKLNGKAQKLTVSNLEKWLNTKDTTRCINIKALVIFCAVTGSVEPIQALIDPLGFIVINEKDGNLLEWAQRHFQVKEDKKRMKQLEAQI